MPWSAKAVGRKRKVWEVKALSVTFTISCWFTWPEGLPLKESRRSIDVR